MDIIKTVYYIHGPSLMCQKEFLLFYMYQLWALHVVIKRQFFTFIIEDGECTTKLLNEYTTNESASVACSNVRLCKLDTSSERMKKHVLTPLR